MARQSLRERLLDSGVQTLHFRGFGASSVRDITAAAGVPLGTFTNHFSSKEDFALAVLDRYFERLGPRTEATLVNEELSPRARLEGYFDIIEQAFLNADWRYGCLIPNMGLELSEHSEMVRERLLEILEVQRAQFAAALACVDWPIKVGPPADPVDAAGVLQAAWHGTLLQMKIERSAEPFRRFRRVLASLLG